MPFHFKAIANTILSSDHRPLFSFNSVISMRREGLIKRSELIFYNAYIFRALEPSDSRRQG